VSAWIDRWYVVGRTLLARPTGRHFVVSEHVDPWSAEHAAPLDAKVLSRSEMERYPALARALDAWDARDDTVYLLESLEARATRDL
jgi:hypothetical protein